jgi:GNAT superfamily N-acetyltransferase
VAEVLAAGAAYALPADTTEQQARDFWMGTGITTYIAEMDGDVVGTYALKPNFPGQGSHVANAGYMVRANLCGRGIGRALAEHSLREARAAGYLAMQFNCVVSTNARAVKLWQGLGFAIIGTVPAGFRHPELGLVDFHIMHRLL